MKRKLRMYPDSIVVVPHYFVNFYDEHRLLPTYSNPVSQEKIAIIYLFVIFRPTREFSLFWRRHHCGWRATNFDLCSALVAIEQLGFFSVPHLLWHRASVFNGHFRGPVTLTLHAERLAVELSLSDLTT